MAAVCRSSNSCWRSSAASYGEEQPAFTPETPHPFELRQPSLEPPVVLRRRKQIRGPISRHSARIAPHVLDVVLFEPALDYGERMPMLFRMLILIAQPRLASRRFAAARP